MKIEEMLTGNFKLCFMNLMQSLQVKRVVFEYSGGGDDGGVDSFHYVDSQDKQIEPDETTNINNIINIVREQLTDPIYDYHGSFAGEYSVSGELVYDCVSKAVYIEGTESTYEYHYDEETDEGEQEIENSECYLHDVVIEKEKELEFHPELALCYAEHIGTLPEELHNKMLWLATEGDEDAKEYLNLKKFKNA